MCIPGPPNDCIFLVISHMTIFFGHTAYMPKFRILSCTHAGVIMTSIFPICFQYVFNNLSIFSIFFILSNLATFQYAFNMFPIFINILQTCHLSPNTAKYGHMTKKNCHFSKFGSIRSNNCKNGHTVFQVCIYVGIDQNSFVQEWAVLRE